MVSLLAFGLPYIPFTNAKCRIVGSASNTSPAILFLQGVGKRVRKQEAVCGWEGDKEVKIVTHRDDQEAMKGVMLTQRLGGCAGPQCACGTLPLHGQP